MKNRAWPVAAVVLSVVLGSIPAVARQAGPPGPPGPPQATPGVEPLLIRHRAIRCMIAERYPLVDACFEPQARLAAARVYFRAEGASEWSFVDMAPLGPCHRATLPRPRPDAGRIRYAIGATDVAAVQAGTPEYSVQVARNERECGRAAPGPFLSEAIVNVGGGATPEGFLLAGKGRALGGKAVAAIVGGAAVVAGGALAMGGGGSGDAGGDTGGTTDTTLEPVTTTSSTLVAPTTTTTTTTPTGPSPTTTTTTTTAPPSPTTTTTTTTTTLPPSPTTTTTTTTTLPPPTTTTTTSTTTSTSSTSSTTTTTTTTTTLAGSNCASDTTPPAIAISSPRDGSDVGVLALVTGTTSDTGSGVEQLQLSATEREGRVVSLGTFASPSASWQVVWVVPSCQGEEDRWTISARATDGCDNAATASVAVRRPCDDDGDDGAGAAARNSSALLVWTSELLLEGGRGQVIANGSDGSFPDAGRSDLVFAARAGVNTVEATVVDARGTPGAWRFTLASGAIRPGSLRVVAGQVAATGPQALVFRLRGRPGERVVFSYEPARPGGQVLN